MSYYGYPVYPSVNQQFSYGSSINGFSAVTPHKKHCHISYNYDGNTHNADPSPVKFGPTAIPYPHWEKNRGNR